MQVNQEPKLLAVAQRGKPKEYLEALKTDAPAILDRALESFGRNDPVPGEELRLLKQSMRTYLEGIEAENRGNREQAERSAARANRGEHGDYTLRPSSVAELNNARSLRSDDHRVYEEIQRVVSSEKAIVRGPALERTEGLRRFVTDLGILQSLRAASACSLNPAQSVLPGAVALVASLQQRLEQAQVLPAQDYDVVGEQDWRERSGHHSPTAHGLIHEFYPLSESHPYGPPPLHRTLEVLPGWPATVSLPST